MLCANRAITQSSRWGDSRPVVGLPMKHLATTRSGRGEEPYSTARRTLLRTLAGVGALGAAGVPVGAAESGATVEFRRCRVAFVSNASAVSKLTVTCVDQDERTRVTIDRPAKLRPRQKGPLRVEYAPGKDRTQLHHTGPKGSIVYVELQHAGRKGWLNPTEECVPDGFSSTTVPDSQVAKLLAEDGQAGDLFGRSVDVDGGWAVVGAPMAGNDGAAYVFGRDTDGGWSQQAGLVPSVPVYTEWVGRSVAIEAETALVGAPGAGGRDSGSVHVFEHDGDGGWPEQAVLGTGDDGNQAFLGMSVAISGDTIVAGAPAASGSGAGFAFVRDSDGTWGAPTVLDSLAMDSGDAAGQAVGVSGDVAVVGAPDADAARGAAHVFVRDGGTWSAAGTLTAPDGTDGDRFGASVAVGEDVAAVGAPSPADTGEVHLFEQGESWNHARRLVPPDEDSKRFGAAVSLDGDVLFVGAPSDGREDSPDPVTHVYTSGADGTWEVHSTHRAGESGDAFGGSVGVGGGTAIVGAHQDDEAGADAGAAYVFE